MLLFLLLPYIFSSFLKECELYCIKSKKYLFPSSHPSWDVRMRIPSVRHSGMVEASSVRTCIHMWPQWCIPKSIQKTQFYLPTVLAATVSISIWILLWTRFKYSSWNKLNTHFYSVIPFTSFSQSLLCPRVKSSINKIRKKWVYKYFQNNSYIFNALQYQVMKIFLLRFPGCKQYQSRFKKNIYIYIARSVSIYKLIAVGQGCFPIIQKWCKILLKKCFCWFFYTVAVSLLTCLCSFCELACELI